VAEAAEIDAGHVDVVVEKARTLFDVPGCAVAIVREDKVVYEKGFGTRELGKDAAITAETLFGIASMTKSITALLIALLIEGGKMDWDDPVRKHIPTYRLMDPTADREVTIRDLLCHRTGLPRHDLIWMCGHDWSREEMVRRVALMTPTQPFRAQYQYNNFQFMVAGHAAGNADGTTWEDSLAKRVLGPLGLKSTVTTVRGLEKTNAAFAHCRADGKVAKIPFRNIDALGPAGSIHSNLHDQARLARLHLGGGVLDGKRLISKRLIDEMHRPHVVVHEPGTPPNLPPDVVHFTTYGLGWNVHDYRGHKIVTHSGSIDGFTSILLMVPDAKLAVIVLNNLQGSPLPRTVAYSVVDHALGLPLRDWHAHFFALREQLEKNAQAPIAQRDARRKADTAPTLKMADYSGTYEHPAYGPLTIEADGDGLGLRYGKYEVRLKHFHYDTFAFEKTPGVWAVFHDETVAFRLDGERRIESLRMAGQDFKRR
jgi:CubicO group peptidase (beta-lactamase class C family)